MIIMSILHRVKMSAEYNFMYWWWRILFVLIAVLGPLVWWATYSFLLAINAIVLGSIVGALWTRALYRRITRPSCTCCTNGDACECEKHCKLHGPETTLPRARIR